MFVIENNILLSLYG